MPVRPSEPAEQTCPDCGWQDSSGLVEGLCPRCLLANVELAAGSQSAAEATQAGLMEDTIFHPPRRTDKEQPAGGSHFSDTVQSDSADELPTIDGFQILSELGRGGMGVVYRAKDLKLGREVALKIVQAVAMSDAVVLQRFYAEAEACARLQHPSIVPIYEVGNCQGVPYFTMPMIDGLSLADRLTEGPLPIDEAARIAERVANALQAAHAAGVIHRDLKPGNILLDENGHPHIIDFGLAKVSGATVGLTATGQMFGTPAYMSPEQAGGRVDSVDERSDVYALGAVLFACLTGRPPFASEGVFETLRQVLDHDVVAPSQLNPQINHDLDALVVACLEKRPEHRPPSAQEVCDELNRFQRGEPMNVRPLGRLATAMRWRRLIRENRQLRLRSRASLLSWPLVHIALGADETGETNKGHARGWLAIGDRATGAIAIGGRAVGVLAYGRLAFGLIAAGQVAIGLITIGALSLGFAATGGLAIGFATFGGMVFGWYALGTLAFGAYAKGWYALSWFS